MGNNEFNDNEIRYKENSYNGNLYNGNYYGEEVKDYNKSYYSEGYNGEYNYDEPGRNAHKKVKVINIISWIFAVAIIGSLVYGIINSGHKVSFKKVDNYLTTFQEFSDDGYEFIDEIIYMYENQDYASETFQSLYDYENRLEGYDFSSYDEEAFKDANAYVANLKSYCHEAVDLLEKENETGEDIGVELYTLVADYDEEDANFMSLAKGILDSCNYRYEDTEDGGINYYEN